MRPSLWAAMCERIIDAAAPHERERPGTCATASGTPRISMRGHGVTARRRRIGAATAAPPHDVVSGRWCRDRLFVALAGGRGEIVEPIDLLCAQLDAVGGGVLLDPRDALGAGDRAMSSPCASSQANATCADVASSSAATA
jgi:hypothetical protein